MSNLNTFPETPAESAAHRARRPQVIKRISRAGLILGSVIVLVLVIGAVSYVKQQMYWQKLAADLKAEEGDSDNGPLPAQSAADAYVSSFSYNEQVTVGAGGFTPAAISVRPDTKLVFVGESDQPHLLKVSPGSNAPEFFEPKLSITKSSVFQTKFEKPGVYSFFDSYNPAASLVVTVTSGK